MADDVLNAAEVQCCAECGRSRTTAAAYGLNDVVPLLGTDPPATTALLAALAEAAPSAGGVLLARRT